MGTTTILDGIRIASPCRADWDDMKGDDRARFCSDCGKHVYNISAMTLVEATALISDREEMPCLRLHRRADGTTLTGDCPVGARAGRRGRLRKVAGLGLVGLAMASTGLGPLGLGRTADAPMPSGPGVTLNDWVDWAMIRLGIRKPIPAVTLGMVARPVLGEPTAQVLGKPAMPPANPNPPAPVDGPKCVEGP